MDWSFVEGTIFGLVTGIGATLSTLWYLLFERHESERAKTK